jgi:hypothetical protein
MALKTDASMSTRTCVLICLCSGMHARTHSTHLKRRHRTRTQFLFSCSCTHASTHIMTHDHTHTQAHTHTKKHANTHTATQPQTLWYASVDRILGQDVRKPSENRGTRVPQIQDLHLSTLCKRASSPGQLRPLHALSLSFALHALSLSLSLYPGPSPSTSLVFQHRITAHGATPQTSFIVSVLALACTWNMTLEAKLVGQKICFQGVLMYF